MGLLDLFKRQPDWKDSHVRTRLDAVERLTDQEALAEIARKDKSWPVREAAVMKLTNEELLRQIIEKDKEKLIRVMAKKRLDSLHKAI